MTSERFVFFIQQGFLNIRWAELAVRGGMISEYSEGCGTDFGGDSRGLSGVYNRGKRGWEEITPESFARLFQCANSVGSMSLVEWYFQQSRKVQERAARELERVRDLETAC